MSNQEKRPIEKVPFTEAEIRFIKKLDEQRVKAENRFPLATAFIAMFGFVSLLYGFEKLIDRIDLLANNPVVLLAIGIITLAVTGTIYKKLSD